MISINDLEEINISNMIYEIRGKQVMLDSDLAKLYHCKNGTKEINQAVKNNIEKFPERYSWKLTEEELRYLRSKILTTNYSNMSRSMPRVFTEQGVAMIATIIKSEVAIQTSIKIMDAFVTMRHYIGGNELRLNNVESKIIEHDNSIRLLFDKLEEKKEIDDVYYAGKIYDSYSKVLDIFKEAKEELIIIDRYADKQVLDMIKELDVKVILITGNKLTKLDIDKYNSTYNNLSVYHSDIFHDRFFIIDRNKIYHSGNSINYMGYRKSCIDVIKYEGFNNLLFNDIDNIINN